MKKKKQDAADIIFDEEEEFENEESLIGYQFTKSIRRVRIHASFPTLKDNTPSCAFMFRPLKLRECIVTVKHDEIFLNCLLLTESTRIYQKGLLLDAKWMMVAMLYIWEVARFI